MLSNANYHVKKTTLLLFINGMHHRLFSQGSNGASLTPAGRSVGSTAIRKAIDATYSTFLPKGGHPFVYLSIDIEPQRVDVNVHPTKREVNFLHEDEIIERIVTAIQEQLAAVDTSRSYVLTQTLLPGAQLNPRPPPSRTSTNAPFKPPTAAGPSSSSKQQLKRPYESDTVRVDARDRKITSMLPSLTRDPSSGGTLPGASIGIGNTAEYEYDDTRQWEEVRYATIHSLRKNVRDSAHGGLAELFQSHIYVGLVDATRRLAAVQHGVKLYLVDYAAVAYELFYQIGLSDFKNFGRIQLNPPLALAEVLDIGVEEEKEILRSNRRAAPMRGGSGSVEDDGGVVMVDDWEGFNWEGATKVRVFFLSFFFLSFFFFFLFLSSAMWANPPDRVPHTNATHNALQSDKVFLHDAFFANTRIPPSFPSLACRL
jgi:DNA mismatch repair protein MLH1